MRPIRRRTTRMLALGAACAIAWPVLSSAAPPFGQPDDVAYARDLWQALVEARLAGSETFENEDASE